MTLHVLYPVNFMENSFKDSDEGDFLASVGLNIGMQVRTIRRVTVEFGASEFRKDLVKGTETFAKGSTDKKVVVRMEAEVDGKTEYSDVAIVADNLEKVEVPMADHGDVTAAGCQVKKHTVPSGFEFLGNGDGDGGRVEVIEDWMKLLSSADDKAHTMYMQGAMASLLNTVISASPTYGTADLVVCKRDGLIEIWTARQSQAGSLVFCP
jgi:hypothetical protein